MRGKKPLIPKRCYFDIWQQRETGMSIKELCGWVRGYNANNPVHPATIYKILAYCRKRFGRLEKLPRPRRARAHLYGQNIHSN